MLPAGCGVALRDFGVDAPELGSRTVSRSRVPLLLGVFVVVGCWEGALRGSRGGSNGSSRSTTREAAGLLYSPDCPTLFGMVSCAGCGSLLGSFVLPSERGLK